MDACRFCNNNKYILFFINFVRTVLNTATLNLLTSSILVSISGAFRVYLASLLLGTRVTMLTCVAGGLVIYSVYTLDRTLDSEEDLINHPELCNPCKEVGFLAFILSLIVGGYILSTEGLLIFAILPFVIGFLYSKGLKIGKRALKLKGGLGVKNFVVGLIWGVSVVGVAGSACKCFLSLILVFIFFEIKLCVNSVIYDFKDVTGDLKAGIKTLPVCLGDQKTRDLLLYLHLISHLLLSMGLINGIVAFEPEIVVYSFICGLVCIWKYTKTDIPYSKIIKRTVLIDGESAVITGLRTIVGII